MCDSPFSIPLLQVVLSRPRDKPKGRRQLGNDSYVKTSRKSNPKGADARLTLTALNP